MTLKADLQFPHSCTLLLHRDAHVNTYVNPPLEHADTHTQSKEITEWGRGVGKSVVQYSLSFFFDSEFSIEVYYQKCILFIDESFKEIY